MRVDIGMSRRKVLADLTDVYRIDPDGNQTYYCWFLNHYGLQSQLAYLLLELRKRSWVPYMNINGEMVDLLKGAKEEVVLTGVDPMPRGFIEHNGYVYFGHVREYRTIEIENYDND